MNLIDTHAHIYLDAFDDDRDAMLARAFDAGVNTIILPNIDRESLTPMKALCRRYPKQLYPLAGLHPTSVKEDYVSQLEYIKKELDEGTYTGIGECGMDLYWDKTYLEQQKRAFAMQLTWSHELGLPIIIHIRDAFNEAFDVLESSGYQSFKGVFHCFSGTREDATRAVEMGFLLGIGGVVTFKKSNLPEIISGIDPSKILLETDSPFLAPVPYRGKRNEPSYIRLVAEKVADIWGCSIAEAARITTENATQLFNLENHG